MHLLLASLCVVLLLWVALKLLKRRKRRTYLTIRDPNKAHLWCDTQYLDKPTYCNACMNMCLSGSSCESCGLCICSDSSCLKLASSSKSCKPLSMATTPMTPHFWVRGNLPLCSLCFKCMSPCGNLPKLADYRCVWCHKTAHDDCIEELDSDVVHCGLGPHQVSLIPPNCVTLSLEGWRGRRK